MALRGSGEVEMGAERVQLDPETIVRVGPGVPRKIVTGPEPLRVLALGGIPGTPYEPPEASELGGPEPLPRRRQAEAG